MAIRTLLTVVALGFSTACLAQERPAFEDVDVNGDGMINRTEASQVEGLDFTTADTNRDGAIDRGEYERLS